MTLQEKIQADLTAIPIRTEKETRELLKTLLAEIKLKKGNTPSDDEVLAVVRKFKENAIECNNLTEVPILDAYLPKMLSSKEIFDIVSGIIVLNNFTTTKDLGQIMAKLKERADFNQIDKKFANTVAKDLLT